MPRPNKKHHKIPATYLHGFTDKNGQLWVINRNFKIYSQIPENILTENDYYTVRFSTGGATLAVETKFLRGIETEFAEIYRTKLKDQKLINEKEKAHLSIFIASMMERQPINRLSMNKFFNDVKEKIDHLRNLSEETKKRMSEIMIPTSDPSFSADELLEASKDVASLHSSLIPETVIEIAPIIFDMKWLFLIRDSNSNPFITSDNPSIMVRPDAELKYGRGTFGAGSGLAFKDVELTFPISSDIALICRWESNNDCTYLNVDKNIINQINSRTMRHADQIVSNNKQMLEKIIDSAKEKQTIPTQS